jgi:hypothetical protein
VITNQYKRLHDIIQDNYLNAPAAHAGALRLEGDCAR